MTEIIKPADYKSDLKPVWCPGCGDFGVLAAVTRAFAALELEKHQTAVISGIGCSSRLPAYLDTYGYHGVHGRALPVATGLKLARPDLTVVVTGGDGDMYSIGAGHFIHACRRDVDMALLVMDNRVYGMTKGQPSPTTGPEVTHPMSTAEVRARPFNALATALVAGAGFVARGFSGDPDGLARIITEAIRHPGFAVVEILSPCVVYRPEQKQWKHQVRRDALSPAADLNAALMLAMSGDEMATGILWRERRDRRGAAAPRQARMDVAAIAEAFTI